MTRRAPLLLCVSLVGAADLSAQTQAPPPDAQPAAKRLTVRGEFRDRMEGGTNIGFASGRDDVYWLNRFRVDVAVTPSPMFSVFVQAQDARHRERRRLDDRAAQGHIRSAAGLRRDRQHAEEPDDVTRRTTGDVLWRAAPDRSSHVGERRPELRRRAGHLEALEGIQGRRIAMSVVRIQDGEFDKERQRQSIRRRLRVGDELDSEGDL